MLRSVLIMILALSGGALIYRELMSSGHIQSMDKLLFIFSSVLGALLRDMWSSGEG